MERRVREHLDPYIKDCEEYLTKLDMFDSLQRGDCLGGCFGNRTDIYGIVKGIRKVQGLLSIDVDFYEVNNGSRRLNWTTLKFSTEYSPSWRIGNAAYHVELITKLPDSFRILYGKV